MTIAPDFEPRRRAEGDHAGRWCLYSAREDRWLDMVFASIDEAREASDVLRRVADRPSAN